MELTVYSRKLYNYIQQKINIIISELFQVSSQ